MRTVKLNKNENNTYKVEWQGGFSGSVNPILDEMALTVNSSKRNGYFVYSNGRIIKTAKTQAIVKTYIHHIVMEKVNSIYS